MNKKRAKLLKEVARSHWERLGSPKNPSAKQLYRTLKRGHGGDKAAVSRFLNGDPVLPAIYGSRVTRQRRRGEGDAS